MRRTDSSHGIKKSSDDSLRLVYVLKTHAIGLGVSRSLAMKGVPVIGIDYSKEAKDLRSNSFVAHHLNPDIEKSWSMRDMALIRR
jgi:hypothetical protein